MNLKDKVRLQQLLSDRKERIESISHFDEYFEKNIYMKLREIVVEINSELEKVTNDILKIYFDDPFNIRNTRYFVMIQFLVGRDRKNDFYLDNIKSYPTLIFQGDEVKGKLIVSEKRVVNNQESNKRVFEIDIKKIEAEDISSIIIDFIDRAYRL